MILIFQHYCLYGELKEIKLINIVRHDIYF